MSHRPLLTPRAVTPLLGLVVLLVISLGWARGPEAAAAATTAGLVLQAGGSCPLTSTQQVDAAKAWKKMMPVFRHPRCLNCHGGVPDPLEAAPGTMHVGVVEISSSDNLKTCEECHEEGWRTAGHKWTALADHEICSSMKQQFSSGQFLEHIEHDKPPLIEMAFTGRRGLNEGAGEAAYEDKSGPLKPDPPPGGFPQFKQLARAWVTAQGGRFVGDNDCGCVVDKLDLHFKSALTVVDQRTSSHAITSTITGEGSVVLKLGPELSAPEWDVSTGLRDVTTNITWSGVSISEPTGCTGQVVIKSSPATSFTFWLGMSYTPALRFSLEIIPGDDLHQVQNRCRLPNGTVLASPMNDPISIFSGGWAALHGPGAGAAGISPTDLLRPPAAGLNAVGVPDMSKMMSMDPKAMAAMMEAMKGKPPAEAAAEMQKFIRELIPGADQMVAAAKNNFKFAIPDNKWCTVGTGTPFLAQCKIVREVSTGGIGTTLKIHENTTITIGRPRS